MTSKSIYDHYDAAFSQVSAYVILKDGQKVATVALKFPKDGAGRLYAYVHWLGLEMVRDFAGGCGYDKRSAAVAHAARKARGLYPCAEAPHTHDVRSFFMALELDSGWGWDRALSDNGFEILQAV